ncbi:MAG: DEAD/DEAH box helicase family protein, partial [Candidatus Cloacimonadaceae bacterium]
VDSRILRPHQENALKNWYDVGRRGILEHATGSGKTFTAICAIKDSLQRNEIPFIVVPSADLLQQWKRELELSLSEFNPTIYLCGGGHSNWKKDLSLITKYDPNNMNKYLILSVLATASTDEFISKFKGGKHIFLVADEVHRLGSMQYRKIFNLESGPRLGLSATPQRFGDPVGTDAIYSYFERVLEPKYTLQDAIHDGVLTEYKYFPTPVSLTNEEQEEWNEYTKKICRRQAILRNSSEKTGGIWVDNQLKKWLIARAKILKNAHEKINAAVKIIEENYKDGQKWIVYCDNIDNQMEELTHRLKTRYRILEYHSRLNQEGRKAVMNQFNMNGGLLISVKCLDEGVDIPTVTHALIIASSKNPREFIQRRGRVLRKSDNKPLAYLYDLIVLPFHSEERTEDDPTLSIIEAELSRAIRFGKDSPYPKSVIDLNNIAIDYKIDLDTLVNGGYDEDEE